MANTFELIQSTKLTSNQATITFSSIPQTYNDLLLRISANNNGTGRQSTRLTFNADTSPNTEGLALNGSGTTLSTTYNPNTGEVLIWPGTASTSGTQPGLCEIYIPRYTSSSTFSPIMHNTMIEENGTSGNNYITFGSYVWQKSAAKTSFTLTLFSGFVYLADSSFYLYGIKNT